MAKVTREKETEPLEDRVVHIARVAKVVKGGRRFSFSALVVAGDGKNKVGYGLGKANEVPDAISKAAEQAKRDMLSVPKLNGTIPFNVVGKFGSATVLMFPAKQGKGIIAGGPVRIIVELCGIQDIVCKVHGTKNHQNVVRAVMNGLSQLMPIENYAAGLEKSTEVIMDRRRSQETLVKKAHEGAETAPAATATPRPKKVEPKGKKPAGKKKDD